jgi:hypothetical protein
MLLAVPLLAGADVQDASPSTPEATTAAPVEVARGEMRGVEQTFLTFPEWYLVHSPAAYADFVKTHPSHEYPFLADLGDLWAGYAAVIREQWQEHYPANPGYHVMIVVIASSTTVEYVIRRCYEDIFGRISWALSSGQLTEEDHYAARVAQDYVDFIRQEPWYLYGFFPKLADLWTDVPLWGPDMVRKWERRFALTTEYLAKGIYGKLIEFATRTAYEPAKLTTQVVVDRLPARVPIDPRIRVVGTAPDGEVVMDLPRYFDFRKTATVLAEEGVNLVDIAGNRSVILVTLWTPEGQAPDSLPGRILFSRKLPTHPGLMRVALIVPVAKLSPFLRDAHANGWTVEHVYDY